MSVMKEIAAVADSIRRNATRIEIANDDGEWDSAMEAFGKNCLELCKLAGQTPASARIKEYCEKYTESVNKSLARETQPGADMSQASYHAGRIAALASVIDFIDNLD